MSAEQILETLETIRQKTAANEQNLEHIIHTLANLESELLCDSDSSSSESENEDDDDDQNEPNSEQMSQYGSQESIENSNEIQDEECCQCPCGHNDSN